MQALSKQCSGSSKEILLLHCFVPISAAEMPRNLLKGLGIKGSLTRRGGKSQNPAGLGRESNRALEQKSAAPNMDP